MSEYEELVGKLERSSQLAKEKESKAREESQRLADEVQRLRVDKNEIKSSLIFTETKLKEVRKRGRYAIKLCREISPVIPNIVILLRPKRLKRNIPVRSINARSEVKLNKLQNSLIP